jgi:hypothetical protein
MGGLRDPHPKNRTALLSEDSPGERRRNELHRSDRRAQSLTFIEALVAYS